MFLLNLREGLLKYQKHYQSLLDEKAKLVENIDKKYAIKVREADAVARPAIEQDKKERVEEIEYKFQEVIDMLLQNYSANM